MDSTIYFEVFVHIRILFGDVLRNDVVGHVAGTAAEVSACPQVSSPKLLLQMRVSVSSVATLSSTRVASHTLCRMARRTRRICPAI